MHQPKKEANRVTRRVSAALVLCLIAFPAQAALPFDCEFVRAYVAQHGKVKAIAFAIQAGATWQQIAEAKQKCLIPPIR